MPTILVSAFLMEGERVLLARRGDASPPFAGQWVLPFGFLGDVESAEECLERVVQSELGVKTRTREFAETLYIVESGSGGQFVTNVFRIGRWDGRPRYRVGGDYQEARWAELAELSLLAMPLPLRKWLLGLLAPEAASAGEVDVRAAWNTISAAYQERHRIGTDFAHYGPRMPTEDDIGLVGDVKGKRVLEIGCGGGQCAIAFAKRGALVVGKDLSDEQVAFARELAAREGVEARFYQGSVEDLSEFPDASQDVVFSAYALIYVADLESCISEVRRVLKPGGVLVFSCDHPFTNMLSEHGPPWFVECSYWDADQVWTWQEGESSAVMRSYLRPLSELFRLLTDAGLVVERILEPPPVEEARDPTWDDSFPLERLKLVPATVIFKARKPA